MEDPALRAAFIGSLIALLGTGTPVFIMFLRSRAESSKAHSIEDSAKAEKERIEAENQKFILDLARSNMQTAQTLINLQNKLQEFEKREREHVEQLDKATKRIAWLTQKILELGGTLDEDISYPTKI